jgi:hypothetical protein
MNSSHSGTPIFSPAVVAVAGAVVAGLVAGGAALSRLVVVSDFEHPISTIAQTTQRIKKAFCNMSSPDNSASLPGLKSNGMEERRNNTRDTTDRAAFQLTHMLEFEGGRRLFIALSAR